MTKKITLPNEIQDKLKTFTPRPYQWPLIDYIEKQGGNRAILVWSRRAGKDFLCFNIILRQALLKTGAYYYILPTHKQARLILFEGMDMDGNKFIDSIPKELLVSVNIQEMKLKLINGSLIYFLGSNNFDSLRGSNPKGIVFSEYAYQHPSVYPTLRPILVANDGFAIFISTPFGENHFYDLYKVAKESKDWFCDLKTVRETKHISLEDIDRERQEGLMSQEMIEQEYFCSFSIGAIGSYYAKYLNDMELNEQITTVTYDRRHPVHTAWDIGMNDMTVIIFFQYIQSNVKIIDLYYNKDVGLDHYISYVKSKNYNYGKHIGPHDIEVRDFTAGGNTRKEIARDQGINFTVAPKMSVMDGIETVRCTLSNMWIDELKCKRLISAIRDYRKEYDSERKVYRATPLHDDNSHFCDSLKYLCASLSLLKTGMTAKDVEKLRTEALYGDNGGIPQLFR